MQGHSSCYISTLCFSFRANPLGQAPMTHKLGSYLYIVCESVFFLKFVYKKITYIVDKI